MKNMLCALSFILALLLTACNAQTGGGPITSEPVASAKSSANPVDGNPEENQSRREKARLAIEQLELHQDDPSVCEVVRDYLEMDHIAFDAAYDLAWRFPRGINYNYDGEIVAPYGQQLQWSGNGWLYPLRFSMPMEAPIIESVMVGDSMESLQYALGTPDFIDEELHLTGYRFHRFHLTVKGVNTVEELSFVKIPNLPETYDSLLDHLDLQPGGIAFDQAYPDYFYFFPGGFWQELYYPNGVKIEYDGVAKPRVYVFQNYPGVCPENEGIEWITRDKDFIFTVESYHYEREKTLEAPENCSTSPDGRVTVILELAPTGSAVGGMMIRYLDRSHPTYAMEYSACEGGIHWLSNRYFLFEVASDPPCLFDVETQEADSLLRLAGWDFDRIDKMSYRIVGDVISLFGYGDEKPQYRIRFWFNPDGAIQVEPLNEAP